MHQYILDITKEFSKINVNRKFEWSLHYPICHHISHFSIIIWQCIFRMKVLKHQYAMKLYLWYSLLCLLKGYKYVFRPGYDREKCDPSKYQPFIFHRSQQSDCAYQKSTCDEDGQITHSKGTTQTDVLCKCDENKGFAFVNTPKNDYCIPSKEDCSCYRKESTTYNGNIISI